MGASNSSRHAQGVVSGGGQMSESVGGFPVRLELGERSGELRIIARRAVDTRAEEEERPRERSVDEAARSEREGEEESETEEIRRDSESEDSEEADGRGDSQLSTMQFLVRLFEGRSPALYMYVDHTQ